MLNSKSMVSAISAIIFLFAMGNCLLTLAADISFKPDLEYKATASRDPFVSWYVEEKKVEMPLDKGPVMPPQVLEPPKVERPLPSFNVQGIIWQGSIPQAIINNKIVKIGDTIEEAKITQINKAGVALFFDGRQYELPSPAAMNLESSKTKQRGEKDEKK